MRLQQEARDNGMLWDVGLGETVEDARREMQCRSVVLWEAGRRGKDEGSRGLDGWSYTVSCRSDTDHSRHTEVWRILSLL